MAFYQYRAADQGGKIVEGIMEAELEQSVVSRLHEMGCVPLRISLPRQGAVAVREQRAPLFKRRPHQSNPTAAVYPRVGDIARRRTAARSQPIDPRQLDRRRTFHQSYAHASGSGARRQIAGRFNGRASRDVSRRSM